MPAGLTIAAYIVASICFILSLGGLSNQETAQRGNKYGIAGMVIAIAATLWSDSVTGYGIIAVAMGIGAVIGAVLAVRVEMTLHAGIGGHSA